MTPIYFPYWLTPLSTENCSNSFSLVYGTDMCSSLDDDKIATDQHIKQNITFESNHLQFLSYSKKIKQLQNRNVGSKRKRKNLVNNETGFENDKSSKLTSNIFFNFNFSDSISMSHFVSDFCILDSNELKVDFWLMLIIVMNVKKLYW